MAVTVAGGVIWAERIARILRELSELGRSTRVAIVAGAAATGLIAMALHMVLEPAASRLVSSLSEHNHWIPMTGSSAGWLPVAAACFAACSLGRWRRRPGEAITLGTAGLATVLLALGAKLFYVWVLLLCLMTVTGESSMFSGPIGPSWLGIFTWIGMALIAWGGGLAARGTGGGRMASETGRGLDYGPANASDEGVSC